MSIFAYIRRAEQQVDGSSAGVLASGHGKPVTITPQVSEKTVWNAFLQKEISWIVWKTLQKRRFMGTHTETTPL